MRKQGQIIIREKLGDYIRLLKEEFSQGLILPTKTTPNTSKTVINTPLPTIPIKSSTTTTPTTELRDIKIQDTFKFTKVELFQIFCDLNKVKAFTQNSVTLYDCKKGGFFSLLSDNVTGRFLDIVPYDRIDMLWRFKSWPSDHYSRVSLTFHDETDQTKLIIEQKGVPLQFCENTKVCSYDIIIYQLLILFF
jgi:activator of HSP90 ATPase